MSYLKTVIESISLTSGAIVTAGLSMGIVWALCLLLPRFLGWLSAVIVPFVLAYCLYWLPVWLGDDPSEYGAWAGLVIGTWFLAGVIASGVVALLVGRRRAGETS